MTYLSTKEVEEMRTLDDSLMEMMSFVELVYKDQCNRYFRQVAIWKPSSFYMNLRKGMLMLWVMKFRYLKSFILKWIEYGFSFLLQSILHDSHPKMIISMSNKCIVQYCSILSVKYLCQNCQYIIYAFAHTHTHILSNKIYFKLFIYKSIAIYHYLSLMSTYHCNHWINK